MTEFAGSLREWVTLERPSASPPGSGGSTSHWEPYRECWAAMVPDGVGDEKEGMALSALARFRVSMRPDPDVAVGHRLWWNRRRFYVRQRIDDPRQRDRMTLRCEEER